VFIIGLASLNVMYFTAMCGRLVLLLLIIDN